jgi:hypothetical protein
MQWKGTSAMQRCTDARNDVALTSSRAPYNASQAHDLIDELSAIGALQVRCIGSIRLG